MGVWWCPQDLTQVGERSPEQVNVKPYSLNRAWNYEAIASPVSGPLVCTGARRIPVHSSTIQGSPRDAKKAIRSLSQGMWMTVPSHEQRRATLRKCMGHAPVSKVTHRPSFLLWVYS